MQNAIHWPEKFLPGLSDNFCSNEVIVEGLSAADIWPLLITPSLWPNYYDNAANPGFHNPDSKTLFADCRFYFDTFGFHVESRVTEYVLPSTGVPGRISWHGWVGQEGRADRLDVLHAWLVEDLSQGRVRILTQETQNGGPAKALATTTPNPMINGHQDWLVGLVTAAKNKSSSKR
ncbi:SRPBCC domain-containing protein [Tatumella sp. TA1]|uniref:polyketide cyclase n=1 Tax=Rosenbergiella collisarenosi TaxID=1544695 RepID=UPI0008F884BB|nr:polyketide cyclase [Rosenbergiella collisarenosi]MBT0720841.1 SRPBCC domain-containing protein [Rosenbergiella collisarenosi]QGX91481.1 SRPBCC domain-containing protein [Tatumella sp. TA1]